MRWDRANLERYRAFTGLYLPSVLDDPVAIEKSGMGRWILTTRDTLQYSSDLTVPSRPKNFFKFWYL